MNIQFGKEKYSDLVGRPLMTWMGKIRIRKKPIPTWLCAQFVDNVVYQPLITFLRRCQGRATADRGRTSVGICLAG